MGNKTVAVVIRDLASKGHRLTKTRRWMIEVLMTSDYPINAIELRYLFANRGLRVNKSTIYRELEFLVKQGVAREVQIVPELKHYESAYLEHHHHLTCRNCGRIEKLVNEGLELEMEKVERLAKESGFSVSEHQLEFYGRCESCI